MMYRLGLRLTLRSGREPLVRLVVTAIAVAVGVAIMLAVLADFHAFTTTNNRPSWESTQGHAVTASYAATPRAELWNYSNDIYQGQTIERLDVAALGPGAPVPPGLSRLPASGQYYASPALAALIRQVPADELGGRFPGQLAGTIGQQALTGPKELVIYIGYSPANLATLPATMVVNKIAALPGRQIWTSFFRDAFIVGALAFVFPILILVGTASRLAAARREERYAALRLVGATSRQIAVISSVDAVVSALLGSLLGIGIFTLLQPALAASSITSAPYFADEVTPTVAGYLVVLIAVPVASAVSGLLSLRRVRISPLGVARRTTPPAPTASGVTVLLIGIALFVAGALVTNRQAIGKATYPGLLLIMIGLVVAGPWLTAQAARLLRSAVSGPSTLLAARRLADSPKAAFRSVSGLVLAVFLGTVVAGILPTIDSISATPSARALSNVLLDGFTAAPVCGAGANCSGANSPTTQPLTPAGRRIAADGLPPSAAAALLTGLSGLRGVTAIPIYSAPPGGTSTSASPDLGPSTSVISCAGLRELAVLGQCAAGVSAVKVPAQNLFDDNPLYSTRAIASSSSPVASDNFSRLYLQALLVKVNNPATLEKVRTYLVTHTSLSASGTAPRTFGESVQARAQVADTVQRLFDAAVALTVVVAGCSLAVAVGGSLVERKRPFTLLRLTGTKTATLYRVVVLEAVLPLVAATIVAAGVAYGVAVLTVHSLARSGTPVPVPGHTYFLTIGAGLVASLLIIAAALPLLSRITGPENVRFE
jgi:FtsX-like permease family